MLGTATARPNEASRASAFLRPTASRITLPIDDEGFESLNCAVDREGVEHLLVDDIHDLGPLASHDDQYVIAPTMTLVDIRHAASPADHHRLDLEVADVRSKELADLLGAEPRLVYRGSKVAASPHITDVPSLLVIFDSTARMPPGPTTT
ncbi:MAG: hypothetical protein M3Q48_02745 [Actinomycetota bacterium]|nr:hypothetical protein [Actinomycetota bacterium]